MSEVTLDELFTQPELYFGQEVSTSGRVVSYLSDEFWLMRSADDISIGRGIRLLHPDLDMLLFENVPSLGGGRAFSHPSIVSGILRSNPGRIPALELENLTKLEVRAGDEIYKLM